MEVLVAGSVLIFVFPLQSWGGDFDFPDSELDMDWGGAVCWCLWPLLAYFSTSLSKSTHRGRDSLISLLVERSHSALPEVAIGGYTGQHALITSKWLRLVPPGLPAHNVRLGHTSQFGSLTWKDINSLDNLANKFITISFSRRVCFQQPWATDLQIRLANPMPRSCGHGSFLLADFFCLSPSLQPGHSISCMPHLDNTMIYNDESIQKWCQICGSEMVLRTDFEEFEEELPHKFYQCRLVFFLFHWTPLQGGAYWCRGSCKVGGKHRWLHVVIWLLELKFLREKKTRCIRIFTKNWCIMWNTNFLWPKWILYIFRHFPKILT